MSKKLKYMFKFLIWKYYQKPNKNHKIYGI